MSKSILITVDLEDWFQVENLRAIVEKKTWDNQELRVLKNTHTLLDLFDSFPYKIKTTFFVLGWIAERVPELIQEIKRRGHEIASHGFSHKLCTEYSEDEFREDISKAKLLLEKITEEPVYGYRAPNFSINNRYLELVKKCGYTYDSSYNSFVGHGRYGKLVLDDNTRNGLCYQLTNKFCELPLSNLVVKGKTIPWAGGGYFRLYPTPIFHYGVMKILNDENAYHFYLHPWEVDPDQPRVAGLPRSYRFRHYVNLNRTEKKLSLFFRKFSDCNYVTCTEYIHNTKLRKKI